MTGHRPQLPTLDAGLIQEIIRRVVDAVRPEKIVLFGSRGRGDHRPHSDIDLLVIQKSNVARHRRGVPIYRALTGLPVEVDVEVIVYTPAEVADWPRCGRPSSPPPYARAGCFMKGPADLARAWLLKASSDLRAAKACLAAGSPDTACFHCQQTAEKCLKAYLIFHGLDFPFTHDLGRLILRFT